MCGGERYRRGGAAIGGTPDCDAKEAEKEEFVQLERQTVSSVR